MRSPITHSHPETPTGAGALFAPLPAFGPPSILASFALAMLALAVLFLVFPGAALAQCPTFDAPVATGVVAPAALSELSGLVASRRNPGILWAHNDSPDIRRLFALDETGVSHGEFTLTGATQFDWEDIAIGPGAAPGSFDLYVGDIGDNAAARANVVVYRVAEPAVSATPSTATLALSGVEALALTYSDGPRDAETLMCDPRTGDLYVVEKRFGSSTGLYRKAAPHAPGPGVLQRVGTVPFGPTVNGGDISPSGDAILLRSYLTGAFWRRPLAGDVATVLQTAPCTTPLAAEPFGEAIGFAVGSCDFYTISEGASSPVYRYSIRDYCGVPAERSAGYE